MNQEETQENQEMLASAQELPPRSPTRHGRRISMHRTLTTTGKPQDDLTLNNQPKSNI